MAFILQRLRIVFSCRTDEELFTKILIVFIGDRCQLPPVCRHLRRAALPTRAHDEKEVPELCKRCHLSFGYVWPLGTHVNLTTVHRFSADLEWLEFLNVIRVRQPTQQEIDHVLGPLFVEEGDARAWVDGFTTVIVSHHVQREAWSERLYDDAVARGEAEPPVETPMQLSGRNIAQLDDWVEAPKFHYLRRASVGMRVVCLANLSDERGALNGSTGTIESITRGARGAVVGIVARMDDSGELFEFSRSHIESTLARSGTCPGWNTKKTFPLMCDRLQAFCIS